MLKVLLGLVFGVHPADERDFSIYSIPQEEDMHLGLARCKTNAMLLCIPEDDYR
jgi:hypothetical protein